MRGSTAGRYPRVRVRLLHARLLCCPDKLPGAAAYPLPLSTTHLIGCPALVLITNFFKGPSPPLIIHIVTKRWNVPLLIVHSRLVATHLPGPISHQNTFHTL